MGVRTVGYVFKERTSRSLSLFLRIQNEEFNFMNKFITNFYGHSAVSTAQIAQHMTTNIAKTMGFKEIAIVAHDSGRDTDMERWKRIEGFLAPVQGGELAVVQLPSWSGFEFDKVLIEQLKNRVEKVVIFTHDFIPLMFKPNFYLMKYYIELYNQADLVILPSEKMHKILINFGLETPVLIQEIWDHTSSITLEAKPVFQRKIKFAGGVQRYPFIKNWSSNILLEAYSKGAVEAVGNVELKGWMHDDQLMRSLNEGGIGLVWTEDDMEDEHFDKAYFQIVNHFKFSTYLAAGLPVIVPKCFAKADFVQRNGLGFVAGSLEEVVSIVEKMNEEEYEKLIENVKDVGALITDGHFTKSLIIEIEKALFLK